MISDSFIVENISKSFILRKLAELMGRLDSYNTIERNFYRVGGRELNVLDILNNKDGILDEINDSSIETLQLHEALTNAVQEELDLVMAVREVKNEQSFSPKMLKGLLEETLYAIVNNRRDTALFNVARAMEIVDGID